MNSAEYCTEEIRRLGSDRIKLEAATTEDARAALARIPEAQKQLRQLKREINSDMKQIRAVYRDRRPSAASGSSAALELFGKRKMAGQVRANAKRSLSSEERSLLKPYEEMKLSIDDLIMELESGKAGFSGLIADLANEDEELLRELEGVHLATPRPDSGPLLGEDRFKVERSVAPPVLFSFQEAKPEPSELGGGWVRAKFLMGQRQKVNEENARLERQYEIDSRAWEARRNLAEADHREAQEKFRTAINAWLEVKAMFEAAERERIQRIREGLGSDADVKLEFLQGQPNLIGWPLDRDVECDMSTDGQCAAVTAKLPEIDDWPIEGSGAKTRKSYLTHIHSIAFRVIGEVFRSLPGLPRVVFSGYMEAPSRTTGQLEEQYLLSDSVWRGAWDRLNFDRLASIDVVECFDQFDPRRTYTKTGIIRPIEPFDGCEN